VVVWWGCGGGGWFPLRSNIPRSALCATLDNYNFPVSKKVSILFRMGVSILFRLTQKCMFCLAFNPIGSVLLIPIGGI
jgi:hypothetical protein